MGESCLNTEYVDLVSRHVREIAELKIAHVRELNQQEVAATEKALILAAENAKWRMGFMLSASGFIISALAFAVMILRR